MPFTFHPYLMQIASVNSCLFSAYPIALIGKADSHEDAPFTTAPFISSESLEGLNSSLAHSDSELLPSMARGAFLLTVAFVRVQFFTNFCFLIHDFGSRYARNPIKGSKDSDDNLVSKKNLSQKLAHWFGTQGRVKLAKKMKKHLHL